MYTRIPLYQQIENDLKNKIFFGHYKPGDLLPSESKLVEIYKVSRLTVREAINRLVIEGLVVKVQGKGTFVTTPHFDHRIGPLYSSGEELLMRYYEVNTEVLELKIITPDKIVKENLELKEDEDVIYLERLRYANKTPVALIKCYLPHKYVPGIENIDFTDESLYRILEQHYGMQLHEAQEIIEAVIADAKSAKLLGVKVGTPLLLDQRITRLIDGTVVEYEVVKYRSDIYKYHNKLVGRGEARIAQEAKSTKQI